MGAVVVYYPNYGTHETERREKYEHLALCGSILLQNR